MDIVSYKYSSDLYSIRIDTFHCIPKVTPLSSSENILVDGRIIIRGNFDELLETQMGICRGSGVMRLENKIWKVQHYVLSIAVPNEDVSQLTDLKKENDQVLITKLRAN